MLLILSLNFHRDGEKSRFGRLVANFHQVRTDKKNHKGLLLTDISIMSISSITFRTCLNFCRSCTFICEKTVGSKHIFLLALIMLLDPNALDVCT